MASIEMKKGLGNFPGKDKGPVKLMVIDFKHAVQAIAQALHMCGFAEIFEWTDLMLAPIPERPFQYRFGD